MRQMGLVAISLVGLLLASPTNAADETQKAKVAEQKAEVLEQSAASEGDNAPVSSTKLITKPGVQAVDPTGEEPLDDAITCLSRTIYWEARGRDATDMEAVANVVMNRLGHEGFPDTVCEVVRQGGEQGNCQFSWWCDGRPDEAEKPESYARAKEIARKALNGQLKDRTGGALYFHQRTVAPYWSAEFIKTGEIGEFMFYKPHDGGAQ